VPPGDIFIHAGDMTDDGTFKELHTAYTWIASLPHKLKIIVAGNHDYSLERGHSHFDPQSSALFTSDEARAKGIVYLDRTVQTVAYVTSPTGEKRPLTVYGNPMQPNFLTKSALDSFTYPPFLDPAAEKAWADAPTAADNAQVWVMHSPPRDHLDETNRSGFWGCDVQAAKIAAAKPRLVVFGHFHFS
jgi:predicted phosphohydrolase